MPAHGLACEKHRLRPLRRRQHRNAAGFRQPKSVQCPGRTACRHGRYGASPRVLARATALRQAALLSERRGGDAGACQLREVLMLKKVMAASCRAQARKCSVPSRFEERVHPVIDFAVFHRHSAIRRKWRSLGKRGAALYSGCAAASSAQATDTGDNAPH